MKVKRFIFKEVCELESLGARGEKVYSTHYALYGQRACETYPPELVGIIYDKEVLELILKAPALEQMRKDTRIMRERTYKDGTSDFIGSMAKWLKRLTR